MKYSGRYVFAVLFGFSASFAHAQFVQIDLNSILSEEFPYAATNVDISRVIIDLSTMAGVPVLPSEGLQGTVTISNQRGTVEDALVSISEQVPIVWWFDGAAVRVERQSEMTSRIVSLGSSDFNAFMTELEAMQLYDARFPIRPASSGSFVRIVAPTGYITEAESLVKQMNAPRHLQVCSRAAEGGSKDNMVVASLPMVLRGQQSGGN